MIVQSGTLAANDAYHLLSDCVIPRPIAWVTSRSPDGIVNAAPFSFFNAVASDPPTVMISVSRRGGKAKDTSRNILVAREFVVNMVNENLAEKMNLTSGAYPETVSEIEKAGLTLVSSELITTPRIAESPVQFECILSGSMEIGAGPTDVLFGEIRVFHIADEILVNGRVDQLRLRAIGRLSGSGYCRTTDTFEMKRPR